MLTDEQRTSGSWLSATGLRLSEWFEHWFPDAFSLACVAVIVVFAATLAMGSSPLQSAQWFGAGFWDLVAFTMQMAMIILTGYAVATSAPVYRDHPPPGRDPEDRQERGRVRRPVLDAVVADVVELQPDFQRAARARRSPTACAARTIAPSAPPPTWASAASGRSGCPHRPR